MNSKMVMSFKMSSHCDQGVFFIHNEVQIVSELVGDSVVIRLCGVYVYKNNQLYFQSSDPLLLCLGFTSSNE